MTAEWVNLIALDFCELLGLKESRTKDILQGLSDYIEIVAIRKSKPVIISVSFPQYNEPDGKTAPPVLF